MIDWNQYTLDEDGNVCDRRDFCVGITRYCQCGFEFSNYVETGTMCEACEAAASEEEAA